MIVLQIRTVRDSLRFRWSEWGCSTVMALWGFLVLHPADSFSESASWSILLGWAPEWLWGGASFILGTARIIVLYRNGKWERCHQARLAFAWAGAFFWACLVAALVMAGNVSTGLAAYIGYMCLEFGTIYIASYDAARLKEAQRDGAA